MSWYEIGVKVEFNKVAKVGANGKHLQVVVFYGKKGGEFMSSLPMAVFKLARAVGAAAVIDPEPLSKTVLIGLATVAGTAAVTTVVGELVSRSFSNIFDKKRNIRR